MIGEENLAKINTVFTKMQDEKTQFTNKWKEISEYIGIEMGNWDEENSTFTPFDSSETFDNTPRESLDTFCNGMEGYAIGRPIAWFRYVPEDDELHANKEVLACLEATQAHNYKVLNSSNFYDEARLLIASVVSFGTGVMWFEDVVEKAKPFFKTLHNKLIYPYANQYGEVDTMIRVIHLTKEDAMIKFEEGNLSDNILNSSDITKEYIFYQYVGPAIKFGLGEAVPGDGDYVSIYWEEDEKDSCFEARYQFKPFVCWRWQRSMSGTSWATECPGINQLSNFAMLNTMNKDIVTLSQYQARGLFKKTKNLKVNFKPGGVTPLNQGEDFGIVESTGDLSWANATKEDTRQSIKSAFYVDFFLALSESVDRLKSATEAAGLQSEKSTLMSSFFSRMANEFLEPLQEWLFWNELKGGRVENYMDEAQIASITTNLGEKQNKLKIDFISPLFLIQRRNVELAPMEEYLKLVLSLASVNFDIAKYKINIPEYLDKTADILGVSKLITVETTAAESAKQEVDTAQAKLQAQQQDLANKNIQADTALKANGASK